MSNTREEMVPSTNTRKKDIRLAKSDLLMMLGFVLALAVLCFTLGVRLGKKQALSDYQKLSLSQKVAENKRLDLLEKINQEAEIIASQEKIEPSVIDEQIVIKKTNPFIENELESTEAEEEARVVEDIEPRVVSESISTSKMIESDLDNQEKIKDKKPIIMKPISNTDPIPFLESRNPALSSSFTIIIGEFMEYEEASLFAQAFKERGYQPFLQKYSSGGIDKVRVSLGSYISKEKAEKFILDRSEVFIAGKYKISKFL